MSCASEDKALNHERQEVARTNTNRATVVQVSAYNVAGERLDACLNIGRSVSPKG